MALTPRLEFRQAQSLTLTPHLMQSIRLLQLSHLELSAFVDAELLRNPLLEREDGSETGDAELPERLEADAGYEDTVAHGDRIQTADSIAGSYDTEVDNVFPEQAAQDRLNELPQWVEHGGGGGEDAVDLDQFVAARPTLADHLWEQAGLLLADPADRFIARALIDSLNEAGYLASEVGAIADMLGTSPEAVEGVRRQLTGCDPVGVFARDLRECLALQLRERDRLDPMMQRLLAHLDLVAAHDLAALSRVVGCDREDLADMLGELRALDPRPGRGFESAPVEAVVPDVFVREGPDGWLIELNSDILPRVLVNRTYYASVAPRARDAGEKTFLADCLATANWLTKSLDQRAQTILKVATEIVRQQDGFLAHGITHLRPMTLRTVADNIEMHESTVSRVTSNKYMATSRGIFEMKYFFTAAIPSAGGGDAHSAEAVRHRIKRLIDGEAPEAVLSDDTIVKVLRDAGIDIARRTVAKYREAMRIPSSVQRRREKLATSDGRERRSVGTTTA
jgi:RNA polymerase sigma-54 factor